MPSAFVLALLICEMLSYRLDYLQTTRSFLVILLLSSSLIAFFTGYFNQPVVAESIAKQLADHYNLARCTLLLSLLLSLAEIARRLAIAPQQISLRSKIYRLILGSLVIIIFLTGQSGGTLVFDLGVGVTEIIK